MIKTSIATSAASIALLLATAAPALAHDGSDGASVNASVDSSVQTTSGGGFFQKLRVQFNSEGKVRVGTSSEKRASSTEKRIEKSIERSGDAIDKRIESLEQLSERLEKMKNLPADTLASIQASIDAQIAQLVALKAKIATSTAVDLKTNIKSITQGNRVFLLAEPQARIAAAAARIKTVVSQLDTFGDKLQERITAAQTAGVDVSVAVSAMTDFNTQLAEAKANADAAVSLTANLKPDNGDKTVFESNMKALKEARAKLAAAHKDLAEARQAVAKIYAVVKGKGEVKTTSN